ncbi:MAG TPA: hypothetical protein VF085_10580 [Solirubrobacterales bacterium]
MSLNLAIANARGVWLVADFRISDVRVGRLTPREDHWSPKYYMVIGNDGTRTAITYVGAAEATGIEPDQGLPATGFYGKGEFKPGRRKRVPVSQWLGWILYGKVGSLEEILETIALEAPKTPELRNVHHSFNGGSVKSNGEVSTFVIHNFDVRDGDSKATTRWLNRRPLRKFHTFQAVIGQTHSGWAGAWGSWVDARRPEDEALLEQLVENFPRDPKDYLRALAALNRRVGEREQTVSAACQGIFIDPRSDSPGFISEQFPNGQPVPSDWAEGAVRANLRGIDITQLTEEMFRVPGPS